MRSENKSSYKNQLSSSRAGKGALNIQALGTFFAKAVVTQTMLEKPVYSMRID